MRLELRLAAPSRILSESHRRRCLRVDETDDSEKSNGVHLEGRPPPCEAPSHLRHVHAFRHCEPVDPPRSRHVDRFSSFVRYTGLLSTSGHSFSPWPSHSANRLLPPARRQLPPHSRLEMRRRTLRSKVNPGRRGAGYLASLNSSSQDSQQRQEDFSDRHRSLAGSPLVHQPRPVSNSNSLLAAFSGRAARQGLPVDCSARIKTSSNRQASRRAQVSSERRASLLQAVDCLGRLHSSNKDSKGRPAVDYLARRSHRQAWGADFSARRSNSSSSPRWVVVCLARRSSRREVSTVQHNNVRRADFSLKAENTSGAMKLTSRILLGPLVAQQQQLGNSQMTQRATISDQFRLPEPKSLSERLQEIQHRLNPSRSEYIYQVSPPSRRDSQKR